MSLSQFFGQGFDPQSVEPQTDFDVLPPGRYPVQIEKADVKPTKKGDGHYLEIQMVVLDGPGKGRKLWDRFNIDNPSGRCVGIAMQKLGTLGRATGVGIITGEAQFLGLTCVACVRVKDNNNEIRTYEPFVDAQSVQAPAPQPAPTVQQPPAQVPPGGQATYCPPAQPPVQAPPQQMLPQVPVAPVTPLPMAQPIAQPAPQQPATEKAPWAR